MKKSTILAGAFVVAAAILAVCLSGERDVIPEPSMPSVVDVQPPPPPVVDEAESEPVIESTEAPVEAAPPVQASSTEPVRLLSSRISEFTVEYANATTEVARRFNTDPEFQLLRSQIVEVNQDGVRSLLAAAKLAPNRFSQPPLELSSRFDLTLFSDLPCAIGAINVALGSTDPRARGEQSWSMRAYCEQDKNVEVSMIIREQSEKITITLLDKNTYREHQLVSLESPMYSLAFEVDPLTRPRMRVDAAEVGE